jgi:hypothetical protein
MHRPEIPRATECRQQSKLYGILHTVQCTMYMHTDTLILITPFQLLSADAHAEPGNDNFVIFRRRP